MTDRSLAVFTPFVGLPSETFVRRHLTEIAPLSTSTYVTDMPRPAADTWRAEDDVTVISGRQLPGRLAMKVARVAGRVHRRPVGRWRWQPTVESLESVVEQIRRERTSAALVEFLDVFLPMAAELRREVETLVVHGHGYDVSTRLRDRWWVDRYKAWADADAIVVVADHSRRRLIAAGLPAEMIEVVPCGVDVPDVLPSPPDDARDVVEFLAVGRLVAKKAPTATVEAFARALDQVPTLRLTLVGDGPMAAEVDDLVERHAISDKVRRTGALDHDGVRELLARSDVFVQHSVATATGEEEGLPVGILEAMAFGLPVVSTRHAGIPEAVVDRETGVLVDEWDVQAMATAMVRLAKDADERRRLGAAGWERARCRFSAAGEAENLRSLLGLDR